MNKKKLILIALLVTVTVLTLLFFLFRALSHQDVTQGAFSADGQCPTFKPRYEQIEITFGNRGLSVINSLFETFLGQGAFEISEFTVEQSDTPQFKITAQSNRGELVSDINADRVVRIGQDKENEKLRTTHQSSFCHNGRIYEHQLVDLGNGKFLVQDLEYWTEGEMFRFRLLQNRKLTADVIGR